MLSFDQIMEVSQQMGIRIEENLNGRHYIFNEDGEKVELNTDSFLKKEADVNSKKYIYNQTNQYKISNTNETIYKIRSVNIEESSAIVA